MRVFLYILSMTILPNPRSPEAVLFHCHWRSCAGLSGVFPIPDQGIPDRLCREFVKKWRRAVLEGAARRASSRRWWMRNDGSPTRARTWDLRINSPSLYQLSYRGIEAPASAWPENWKGAYSNSREGRRSTRRIGKNVVRARLFPADAHETFAS